MVSPVLWFIFSAWMLVLEYADYPMGNRNIASSTQRGILEKKATLSVGFGSAALAMTLIPVLNFVVMPIGVAGATCMWVREFCPSDENVESQSNVEVTEG
jgi:CysZ protein